MRLTTCHVTATSFPSSHHAYYILSLTLSHLPSCISSSTVNQTDLDHTLFSHHQSFHPSRPRLPTTSSTLQANTLTTSSELTRPNPRSNNISPYPPNNNNNNNHCYALVSLLLHLLRLLFFLHPIRRYPPHLCQAVIRREYVSPSPQHHPAFHHPSLESHC